MWHFRKWCLSLNLRDATYRTIPKSVALRAGDALHLATARANEIARVYSSDVRLLSAARYFVVAGSDPAAQNLRS